MYTKSFHTDSLEWTPSGIDKVDFKVLDGELATTASVVVYRFGPGSVVQAHSHTHADEWAYVMDGDFIENGITYKAGSMFTAPAGTVHGEHKTVNGCTVMFVLSKGLDFVPAA
jgi:quercetin dioxygenase-like cupin family protein